MTALKLFEAPRPLGKSEISVHPLAWGMWRMSGDVAAARERIAAAWDIGITLFDTADIYGLDAGHAFGAAEALLGDALRADPGLRRQMKDVFKVRLDRADWYAVLVAARGAPMP